ncbi:hypothetical protein A2U01_0089645 [Trifolium medium]|uniref:Uncharacterized protein n=1 Tax=Trifolium medium TaxID=97028 RepID=A0A392U6I3_9FABA|nr:hypothetical protein [Trifolium medium]
MRLNLRLASIQAAFKGENTIFSGKTNALKPPNVSTQAAFSYENAT